MSKASYSWRIETCIVYRNWLDGTRCDTVCAMHKHMPPLMVFRTQIDRKWRTPQSKKQTDIETLLDRGHQLLILPVDCGPYDNGQPMKYAFIHIKKNWAFFRFVFFFSFFNCTVRWPWVVQVHVIYHNINVVISLILLLLLFPVIK